jgi:hypothetical protein
VGPHARTEPIRGLLHAFRHTTSRRIHVVTDEAPFPVGAPPKRIRGSQQLRGVIVVQLEEACQRLRRPRRKEPRRHRARAGRALRAPHHLHALWSVVLRPTQGPNTPILLSTRQEPPVSFRPCSRAAAAIRSTSRVDSGVGSKVIRSPCSVRIRTRSYAQGAPGALVNRVSTSRTRRLWLFVVGRAASSEPLRVGMSGRQPRPLRRQ